VENKKSILVGVMDGHGGDCVMHYVKQNFSQKFLQNLIINNNENIEKCLIDSFEQVIYI
jgi:serine/threonine protein phosphatase PrpC